MKMSESKDKSIALVTGAAGSGLELVLPLLVLYQVAVKREVSTA
jgi:hypothetical protein